MSAINYPYMIEVQDIIESMPGNVHGEDRDQIASMIRVAYWRGVHHYKDDPENTKKRLEEYINSL